MATDGVFVGLDPFCVMHITFVRLCAPCVGLRYLLLLGLYLPDCQGPSQKHTPRRRVLVFEPQNR